MVKSYFTVNPVYCVYNVFKVKYDRVPALQVEMAIFGQRAQFPPSGNLTGV